MKHLLTHTAGFEDGALGYLIIKDEDELVPLRESLAAHIPERVRPPGAWSSYSNYGTALAGLIVEEISGMPFAEYIEKNIFEPLRMEHSTFREPLPEHLAPDMAVGYKRKNGLYEPEYFEFISNFGPAGALSSTATDMAHFMIAHLQLGRYGDQRILEEATARQMHSLLYTPDPRLPGMAYGFYESDVHGQHIIGHGGDTVYFHSDLALLTEHERRPLRLLRDRRRPRADGARRSVRRALLPDARSRSSRSRPRTSRSGARSSPAPTGSPATTRATSRSSCRCRASSRSRSSPDGTLMTAGVFEEPWHWVEVEPNFFRQIDGEMTLAFIEDENGNVTHMSLFSTFPFMPAYRIRLVRGPDLQLRPAGARRCAVRHDPRERLPAPQGEERGPDRARGGRSGWRRW